MHGVSGVTDRIAQIQSRIDQLSPQRAASSSAFAAVLGGVVQAQTINAPGAVRAGAPGAAPEMTSMVGTGLDQVDSKGVPIAFKDFGNGRIPSEALTVIEGTPHKLWAPAARSFEAMRSAAAAEGVTIGITDSYRTYESQVDLVHRKGLYSQGGLAAEPGTSKHGWGIALDLKLDSTAQAWIRANGSRFGFVENVPREPWHWQYKPLTP